MKRSPLKNFLEASKSKYQDIISDCHRAGRGVLDVKEKLEKVIDNPEFKDNKDLKWAIEKLNEIDVEIEYVARQVEQIDGK